MLTLQRLTNALPNHVNMAAAASTRLPATVVSVFRDTPEITARQVSDSLSAHQYNKQYVFCKTCIVVVLKNMYNELHYCSIGTNPG